MTAALGSLTERSAPQWAKQASAPLFRAYGQLTAATRPLPDFLIVGTKRGGTTSLLKYLQRHPGVMPLWPEIQNSKKTWYFDDHYDRPERWYRSFQPTQRQLDRVGERLGYAPVCGEAAPYYMFHPLVAERVAETVPDVRIIVLLRNPVDRAYSHWNERRNAGVEPLPFDAAIEAESARIGAGAMALASRAVRRSDPHDFYSYLARGDYLPQLERWLAHFPPAQLLVVRSEDLYARPAEALSEVHRFLGLPHLEPPTPHRYNRLDRPPLDDATRARLRDHFAPRVDRLQQFLGRDFAWDLAPSDLR